MTAAVCWQCKRISDRLLLCRLMRRLLADLHAAGLLDTDTLEVWRYDNSDVTKDKVGTLCVRISLRIGCQAAG